MIDAQWTIFLLASVVVIVTPGQDMLLVIARSITYGVRAGVATAAGVSVGLLGHTLLAAAGLGALLRTSDWLFFALKLVGAAYLLHLGVQLLRTRGAPLAIASEAPTSLMRQFVAGAASNIANPKIAVFFFAFLPQFVAHDARRPALTVLVLGGVFSALTFLVKGPVALFGGRLSVWFRSRDAARVWLYRVSGGVMVALALRLALARRDV